MTMIRIGSNGDLEPWSQMRADLWPQDTAQRHRDELSLLLGERDFSGWLALDGEKYIGFAEASLRPFANGCESRPVAFLEGIWVQEKYRKTGVGKLLLAAVEDWAKEQGINELGSDAHLENTSSHRAHVRWGFEETERVVYFRKKL